MSLRVSYFKEEPEKPRRPELPAAIAASAAFLALPAGQQETLRKIAAQMTKEDGGSLHGRVSGREIATLFEPNRAATTIRNHIGNLIVAGLLIPTGTRLKQGGTCRTYRIPGKPHPAAAPGSHCSDVSGPIGQQQRPRAGPPPDTTRATRVTRAPYPGNPGYPRTSAAGAAESGDSAPLARGHDHDHDFFSAKTHDMKPGNVLGKKTGATDYGAPGEPEADREFYRRQAGAQAERDRRWSDQPTPRRQKSGRGCPILGHIKRADLLNDERLTALFQRAKQAGLVGSGDGSWFNFVAFAEHCLIVPAVKNAPALFADTIRKNKDRQMILVCNEAEESASLRLTDTPLRRDKRGRLHRPDDDYDPYDEE